MIDGAALLSRTYTAGKRRITVYVSWSYPAETQFPLHELDNRFSALWEVRRVGWPKFENMADPAKHLQGIDGTLELFFRDWELFATIAADASGFPVPFYQRFDPRGRFNPLDERILDQTDTLLVFSLDHQRTRQTASPEEIAALRAFVNREGTYLVVGPHHDVGASDDLAVRQEEYRHHGDRLVPRQQRFGTFGLSVLRGLNIPVINRYGLNPARADSGEAAPLNIARDLDTAGLLEGVTSFSLHPHLPHYALTGEPGATVQVLATQKINPNARPHPFTDAGNGEFNALVVAPPAGDRGGTILVMDSTHFTGSLFGSSESLKRFWRNLATVRQPIAVP